MSRMSTPRGSLQFCNSARLADANFVKGIVHEFGDKAMGAGTESALLGRLTSVLTHAAKADISGRRDLERHLGKCPRPLGLHASHLQKN